MGFGLRSENGYIRAPLPAARITPTIVVSRLAMRFAADLASNELAHDTDRVERANLLAFFERASGKAHRHFGKPCTALRQPRGEFRFEVEPVGVDAEPLDERRPVHLVAGHQVGYLDAVQHARGARHGEVADA